MQYTNNSNSIQCVVQLDKDARQKVLEAKLEAEQILNDADKKKKEMFEEYKQRAEKRLEMVSESYGAQADEEIAEIERKKLEVFASLDTKMAENRAKWEKEIISAVTGE